MKLHLPILATLTLCAIGCAKDFNGTIACGSDLNCPTGYHCASDGKCHSGEASVAIEWVSPPGGAIGGTHTFSVKVSHPDGVSSVKLFSGTTQLGSFTAPSAGFGATSPQKVDFPGVDTSQFPDGTLTLDVQGTSRRGQQSSDTRAFVVDNHEGVPTPVATTPPSPSNTSTPFLLKGLADVGANAAPSTVYVFNDPTCDGGAIGGAIASGPADTFVEPGLSIPVVGDSVTTYYVMSVDSVGNKSGCSGGLAFVDDQSEPPPAFAMGSLASGNTAAGPFLTGTAATGPSPSTVSLFASADCSGPAVAAGPATDFVAGGIQVPLLPNALTVYSAQSTDAAGNVSACSSSVPGGTLSFTNAQACRDGAITSAQLFSPPMQGCGAKVTFPSRASVCAPGCQPATADEWVRNSGGTSPTHHYWTDDALNFSAGSGACGAGGCTSDACFATRTINSSLSCAAAQPMRVCMGTGAFDTADPDGNTCTWSACGYNSVAPKQFFGGCSGAHDDTAGTLCTCGVHHWFVSVAGNDGNLGTPASPFRTIGRGLFLSRAGDTVFVSAGTYNTETFPLHVPAGAFLIGDEVNRGNTGGQPTVVTGTIIGGAGSVVAGFLISVTGANGITANAPGAIIRNNTFTGNSQFSVQVSAPNQTFLLNAFTNNPGWGILYSAGSTATGRVENNTFTGNQFGIEVDAPPGDMGGGAAGSLGNNTFSCNSNTDLWGGVAGITANNNHWDHNPPSFSSTTFGSGLDLFGGTAPPPTSAGASQTAPSCP
jgi:uncharacterized protein DUF1565